jgi:hypothetical protein
MDHLCRVRVCVNPDHLEAVTHKVNIHRSPTHSANKTHCKHGHSLSGNNLGEAHPNGKKKRFCLICSHASGRRYRYRRDHPDQYQIIGYPW